jgi:tetratricopeptide (TPR) repeat protein
VASQAPPPAAPEVPGFAGLSLLGTGGFGSVWEAVDGSGAPVAIKVSHFHDSDAQLRFDREASLLARVGPPHVPAPRGNGILADGRPYLAMERLSGRTLADEIERWSAPPPLARLRELGAALLESAAAVHACGVEHRDLKPENVFLVDSPGDQLRAKLMDFGFSRGVKVAGPQHTISAPGAGTPEYLAPEQIVGNQADCRADVYALGLLLFEMATLRLPFVGDRRELEYAHLSYRPPPPSDFAQVPAPLEQVILRCLAKDPALRFADAGALRGELARVFTVLPEGPMATKPPRASRAGNKATPPGGSERQKMVLLFAQGPRVSATEVQPALQPFSGLVAQAAAGLACYTFDHRAGRSPGLRALAAAHALLAAGLAERLIIDVGDVTVKARPGGTRLFGSVFSEADRYPRPGDPRGILLSPAARVLFPSDACQPTPARPGYFALGAAAAAGPFDRSVMEDAPSPLVGRADLLRVLLQEATTAVSDGRSRVASVLAEPGLGKTRVARELGRRLREQLPTAELIEMRAREPLGGPTDDALADLLRRTLALPGSPPADGGRALLEERIGEAGRDTYISVALLLGWIASDHPAVEALRAAPGVLRANLARAGFEALRRLATRQPVLVVLDDAHWADDTLLDALEQATAAEVPLWLCALGRPAFADGRPSWGERASHVHRERLGPLDRDSAAQLCRHLLHPATDVPEPVVIRLVDRTEGMPLLLSDLVQGLRREGLVREQIGGAWCVATEVLDQLPDSPLVEWIAGRELDQLPPELAAHARLVSLLCPEISVAEVNGVLERMDRDLADIFPMDAGVALERLEQLGLLVQHRNGSFSFRNTMIREGVAKRTGEAQATAIHRSALAFYRSAPVDGSLRASRLAWHAARAGERQEAGTTYLWMAESARQGHRYLEADLLYSQALSHLDDAQEAGRLRALQGRGNMRYRLGRYQGSREDLALARDLAVRGGDPATQVDVMLDESMALDWLFEWSSSRELAERARELARGLSAPALQARVLLAVGRSLTRFNQDREAADLLRQASRRAEAIGDEGYEVQVTAGLMLGFLLPLLGLVDEAEDYLLRVNQLCEAKGDELHLAALWINRSCLWIARNDRERFLEDIARLLAYARRMGSASMERFATFNSACFFLWRGECAEAEPYARRIVEIDDRYFDRDGFRPESSVLLARVLWGKGDEVAAQKLVAEIRARRTAASRAATPAQPLQPNDEVLLDMMALVVAEGGIEQWPALVERARTVAQGQELIEVLEMAGLAAERRGDRSLARRWWQEALAAGERIPNVMSGRLRQRLETSG